MLIDILPSRCCQKLWFFQLTLVVSNRLIYECGAINNELFSGDKIFKNQVKI